MNGPGSTAPRRLRRIEFVVVAACVVALLVANEWHRRGGVGDLALALAFGASVSLGAWFAASVVVLWRAEALLALTARLIAGDYAARSGLRHGNAPLGRLAHHLDALAETLARQRAEQEAAQAELRLSDARKAAVLEASLDGILVLDGLGRVQECNAAARRTFGCTGRRCVHHQLTDLFPRPLPFASAGFGRATDVFETTGMRIDRSEFPAELSIAPIRDPAARGLFVATLRDITERKRWQESMEQLSYVDELTGLGNRRGFLVMADRLLKLAARNDLTVMLVLVDLDGLKDINDTYGHANGDRALIELATALRASFRESDVVARLGGDEFVVLACESEQAGAELALERFSRRLERRNADGELPWTLSASMGWLREAATPRSDLAEMLERVDRRMYDQKSPRPGRRAADGAAEMPARAAAAPDSVRAA